LKTDLFFQGVRPAVDAGQSVSRVGGNAQINAMRKIAGPLRLNLAQFRELAAFAEFGSELDASSLAQLERGRRVVEVLKQPQFSPVPVEEQVLVLYAVTEGHMDHIPTRDVKRFELELRDYFRTRHGDVLSVISDTGKLPEGDELADVIGAFKQSFEATEEGE
jgi:F-type H+-transporting ATPase subunit alpha